MSSTFFARFGIRSEISMPLLPCFAHLRVLGRITSAQEGYRATFNTYSDTSNDHPLAGTANGTSGTITITHNGRYGQLAVKAVALEPTTGFSFDIPGQHKPVS